MSGVTITLYRRRDTVYLSPRADAEPITMELAAGVRVRDTAMGEARFFQLGSVYGRSLELALGEGWCWVVK